MPEVLPATLLVNVALTQLVVVKPPTKASRPSEIRETCGRAVPTVPEPSCKAVQLSGEDPAAKPIVRDHARPTAADQLLFSPEQSCRIMPSTAGRFFGASDGVGYRQRVHAG
jgi:hypothetical protein